MIATKMNQQFHSINHLIGYHETQVSEGGEVDLHKHNKGCKKNPGHTQFIPANLFEMKHLPDGHQEEDLYELIKAIADLTVHIEVKMTSMLRPDCWPGTNNPYPCIELKGKKTMRCGSGRVTSAILCKDKEGGVDKQFTKCWCTKCQKSGKPNDFWWEFFVETAAHVIFNEEEASHTILNFFYDYNGSPKVVLDKVSIYELSTTRDWCRLKCVTCDINLGSRLEQIWTHFSVIWKIVYRKYRESRDVHKLAFVVSHPHGCSKQISLGCWREMHKVKEDKQRASFYFHKFTYNVSTCPGSSGAPVYCVGYSGGTYSHVHSGSSEADLNLSCACRFL
uniref:Uncharacterized protein n=1 Tax=Biomphalaria glabrata TaxID=6526 RepID=A0A2C9L9C6_BIOGL